jgi:hypothetical protein
MVAFYRKISALDERSSAVERYPAPIAIMAKVNSAASRLCRPVSIGRLACRQLAKTTQQQKTEAGVEVRAWRLPP